MELFAIHCTTCQARLKVRDLAAIGKILACPKCASMVQVLAPAGWEPPPPSDGPPSNAMLTASNTVTGSQFVGQPAPGGATTRDTLPLGSTLEIPIPDLAPRDAKKTAAARSRKSAAKSPASAPPREVKTTTTDFVLPPPVPSDEIGLLARLSAGAARHWLLLVSAPVAVIVIGLLAWIVLQPGTPTNEPVAIVAPPAQTATNADAATSSASVARQDDIADAATGAAASPAPGDPQAEASVANDPKMAATDGDATEIGANQPSAESPADQSPEAQEPPADAAVAQDNGEPEGNGEMPPAAPAGKRPPAVADAADPLEADAPAADDARPAQGADPIANVAGDADAPSDDSDAAEAPAEAPETRETIPQVDVAARMADPLPSLQFKRIALADYCDFLSKLSTVPITIDVDALAVAGVHAGDSVSINLKDTTVAEALAEVLSKRGLTHIVVDQQLIVVAANQPSDEPVTTRYDVRDLADQADDVRQLAAWTTRFVAPATWQEHGGAGKVTVAEGALIVQQSPAVQRRLVVFFDKLRQARGLPAKGNLRPEEISLRTHYGRAKGNLDKTVTANFSIETPLVEILSWLARATGTRLLIDEASLRAAGLWSRAPATLLADNQPLHAALAALLEPQGLTYRVVDERTVQIFSKNLLPERDECEFYSVSDLLAGRLDPKELLAKLREHVDPKTWSESGGSGVVELDERSKSLLVLQSPETHIRVENTLTRAKPTARPAQ